MIRTVFIGIRATEEITSRVVGVLNAHKVPERFWVHPNDLRVTLVPPWQAARIPTREEIQRVVKEVESFAIRCASIEGGPLRKKPRLLWALAEPDSQLMRLKEALVQTLHLRQADLPLPHITIARFPAKGDSWPGLCSFEQISVDWCQPVQEVELLELRLNTAPRHDVLTTVPLGTAAR